MVRCSAPTDRRHDPKPIVGEAQTPRDRSYQRSSNSPQATWTRFPRATGVPGRNRTPCHHETAHWSRAPRPDRTPDAGALPSLARTRCCRPTRSRARDRHTPIGRWPRLRRARALGIRAPTGFRTPPGFAPRAIPGADLPAAPLPQLVSVRVGLVVAAAPAQAREYRHTSTARRPDPASWPASDRPHPPG